MKVVIFGAGRRGLRLARHLIEEKKQVVFLDASADNIYASAEIRNGWNARIISLDYNMRKPA